MSLARLGDATLRRLVDASSRREITASLRRQYRHPRGSRCRCRFGCRCGFDFRCRCGFRFRFRLETVARVLKADETPDALFLLLGMGSAMGIGNNWTGTVLIGGTDTPLTGGNVKIVRVNKNLCVVKTRLTLKQLGGNTRVRLKPPD
jgi:hypothetical protein